MAREGSTDQKTAGDVSRSDAGSSRSTGAQAGRSVPLSALYDDADDRPSDHWLDQLPSSEEKQASTLRAIVQETFGQPYYLARRVWSFVTTSPGKITAMTAILSVALFAAGFAMSQSSGHRQEALDQLLTNTEPVSYNAHILYTTLSVADTMATTGFVQAGIESPQTRAKYNTAVERASVAAAETAAGAAASDQHERLMELLVDIQGELPVYSGLVETARTNNRAGNPVGVAYMTQANDLMRDTIMPAAAELYNITSREVVEQQHRLSRPQWVPLSGLFAALGFLIIAQWWLMRITRRRINRGFLTATAMMLTAMIWVSAANYATWSAGTQGFQEASAPLNSMTTARIYAQQARTSETLALVRRQSVQGSATGFNATVNQIHRALDEYEATAQTQRPESAFLVEQARDAVRIWGDEHEALDEALASGEYRQAVDVVLGDSDETSFDDLDSALAQLIAEARASMRSYIQSGLAATEFVAVMVLMLSLASVVAVWLGIRPRLQEYL